MFIFSDYHKLLYHCLAGTGIIMPSFTWSLELKKNVTCVCRFYPVSSGIFRCHPGSYTINPVPAETCWRIQLNESRWSTANDITTTEAKQSTTKLRKYFMGYIYHDDVSKWKYFRRYGPFVRGIHRSLVDSPKACEVELWCFLWSAPAQTVEQTYKLSRWAIPFRMSIWSLVKWRLPTERPLKLPRSVQNRKMIGNWELSYGQWRFREIWF